MSLELPNSTLFIQFFFFMGTVFVLSSFVFSPLLAVIDERRKKSVHALAEAQKFTQEAIETTAIYKENLEYIRSQLRGRKERLRQELSAHESAELLKAEGVFLTDFREAEKKISAQVASAHAALSSDITSVAEEIFSKLSASSV